VNSSDWETIVRVEQLREESKIYVCMCNYPYAANLLESFVCRDETLQSSGWLVGFSCVCDFVISGSDAFSLFSCCAFEAESEVD